MVQLQFILKGKQAGIIKLPENILLKLSSFRHYIKMQANRNKMKLKEEIFQA